MYGGARNSSLKRGSMKLVLVSLSLFCVVACKESKKPVEEAVVSNSIELPVSEIEESPEPKK